MQQTRIPFDPTQPAVGFRSDAPTVGTGGRAGPPPSRQHTIDQQSQWRTSVSHNGRTVLPRNLTLIGVGCIMHAWVGLCFAAVSVAAATVSSETADDLRQELDRHPIGQLTSAPQVLDSANTLAKSAGQGTIFLCAASLLLVIVGVLRLTRRSLSPIAVYAAVVTMAAAALYMFAYDMGLYGVFGVLVSAGLAMAAWSTRTPRVSHTDPPFTGVR